jgi:rSAM/selenodomain-associated transferase 1
MDLLGRPADAVALSQPQPLPAALVLARWWSDGPVKTRLAAEIGASAAREAYRQLAESVWNALADARLERHLWATPPERLAATAAWLPGASRVTAQPEVDLGMRLRLAFASAIAGGAPWAAAVGTDAPDLDASMVLRAGAELARADVVLVPALDGGYALIALTRPQPELFSDIPWSTPQVLVHTLKRAADLGLRVTLLPPVRDVDTLDDLRCFADRFPGLRLSKPG